MRIAGHLITPSGAGAPSPSPRHGTATTSNNLLRPASTHGADPSMSPSNLKHSAVSRATPLFDRRLLPLTSGAPGRTMSVGGTTRSSKASPRKTLSEASVMLAKTRARSAQKMNDSMVYLDGPQVYTCAQCRTHLTSHDDIISKSFHGRHGKYVRCCGVSLHNF